MSGQETKTLVELGDRTLEVMIAGPEGGEVVIAHTGTPSSGHLFRAMIDAGAERGLRHVTYARPGYAGSSRLVGRSVADCAGDVAAIADQLGIDSFYTVGWSGGGPHAIACAALLPDRVRAAASIAGLAPQAPGLDWYAGMGSSNAAEFELAERGEAILQRWLEHEAAKYRGTTPTDLADALGDLVCDADRRVLTGEFAAYAHLSLTAALENGIWGWLDDDLAFVRGWGFDLGDMAVPVAVWHGVEDRFVPIQHGEWLAEYIRGAEPRLLASEGHVSLSASHYGGVLDELQAAGS